MIRGWLSGRDDLVQQEIEVELLPPGQLLQEGPPAVVVQPFGTPENWMKY